MQQIEHWLGYTPTWITGLFIFLSMVVAAVLGSRLRAFLAKRQSDGDQDEGSQEGYVVSAVLGLLALLLGFTFSIAVDRFDARRVIVLQEANSIGTAYLRAQLLDEPNRSRMSGILLNYTENRVELAQARAGTEKQKQLLAKNEGLLVDLWAATAASFDSIRNLDFSSSLVESVNAVVDDDAARKAARQAHVPTGVFVVLFAYMLASACMLGYVLGDGRNRRLGATVFLMLLSLSMLLIIDIDKPTTGWVRESQLPMIQLRDFLRQQPPGSFDKWRADAGRVPAP